MLPKLSIIVPCYNSAKYIEETLSSIAAQNYPNLELIIMDGGSKDETPAIVEKFRPLVSTFISEKDKGQADAILKGFARATGDYVGWCNADDTYLPGALLAAGQALAENPACDIVFGDKDYTDADNQFLFRAQAFTPSIPKLFPFPQIYSEAFLVRREILSEINLNPERHHLMDLDWFVRLFLAGKNFLKAENFRATFRQHADAKSSKQAAVCHRESFDIALSTYSHPRLSPADKSHLIHSMRLMLHNFWGEENYPALREGLARAEKQVGKSIYTPKLTLQLCLSYLGAPAIAAVKKFLRKAITFITYRRERYLMTRLYSNPFEKLPILPLPVENPLRLVMLTTPKGLINAVWCAFSVLKNLDRRFALTLVINGELPSRFFQDRLRQIFPSLEIYRDKDCLSGLQRRSLGLERLAQKHPMGYKLASIFYFNSAKARNEKILFCDDDIMAFRRLDEIITWADATHTTEPLFIQEYDITTRHDPLFAEAASSLGLKAPKKINVGLLALPKGTLDIDSLEKLLTHVETLQSQSPRELSWFPDTSALAFQLSHGLGLPPREYLVSTQRQFWGEKDCDYSQIKLRHFVGPVRHLLRLRGVPLLLKQLQNETRMRHHSR